MVCRSKERGEIALSSIQSKTGNPNIHLEVSFFSCSAFHRDLIIVLHSNLLDENSVHVYFYDFFIQTINC